MVICDKIQKNTIEHIMKIKSIFFIFLFFLSPYSFSEDGARALDLNSPSASGANTQLKAYKFTQSFVDCVKAARPELATDSAVDSSTMGGDNIFSGGPINDAEYWAYMSCLNKNDSGVSNIDLPTSISCDGGWISRGKTLFYIAPGNNGKSIVIEGDRYSCENGNWNSDVSPVSAEPQRSDAVCEDVKLTHNQCNFQMQGGVLGDTVSVTATNLSYSEGGFYSGTAVAVCTLNGWSFEGTPSCQIQECTPGQRVSWAGDAGAICEGVVSQDGEVNSRQIEPIFRATLEQALFDTKIPYGVASMYCKNGSWHIESSNCAIKPQEQLVCKNRVNDAGLIEYYCK